MLNLFFYLSVFFSPFTAFELIRLFDKSISPFLVFSSIFILLFSIDCFVRNKITRVNKKTLFLIVIFLIALINTLHYFINGPIYIQRYELHLLNEYYFVDYKRSLLKNYLLISGLTFAYCSFSYMKRLNFRNVIRFYQTFILSLVFASLWGALQFCSFLFDFQYPHQIFNHSVKGFEMEFVDGLRRVNSITHEPNTLGKFLLIGLTPLTFSLSYCEYIFSKKLDLLFFLLFSTVIILTTSTTAIVGYLLLISYVWSLNKDFKFKTYSNLRICVLVLFLLPMAAYLAYLISPSFIRNVFINKFYSYSADERVASLANSLDYFLDRPLLGYGIGVVNSDSIITVILTSFGIVGFISFLLFTISLFSSIKFNSVNAYKSIFYSGYINFSLILLLSILSGMQYYLPIFYVSLICIFVAKFYKGIQYERVY